MRSRKPYPADSRVYVVECLGKDGSWRPAAFFGMAFADTAFHAAHAKKRTIAEFAQLTRTSIGWRWKKSQFRVRPYIRSSR